MVYLFLWYVYFYGKFASMEHYLYFIYMLNFDVKDTEKNEHLFFLAGIVVSILHYFTVEKFDYYCTVNG